MISAFRRRATDASLITLVQFLCPTRIVVAKIFYAKGLRQRTSMSPAIRSMRSSSTIESKSPQATRCRNTNYQKDKFFLVTAHRAENVDDEQRLRKLVQTLVMLNEMYRFCVICSLHPRTRAKMRKFGIEMDYRGVRFVEPLGFFDFIRLEETAFCVLSDSGTVQEETSILGAPSVTIRDATERPETIECGSTVLSGLEAETVLRAVEIVTGERRSPQPPAEYVMPHVSNTVIRIVLGHCSKAATETETAISRSRSDVTSVA